MNRHNNLRVAVKSWYQFKQITEIIVLDYGSTPALKARFFTDPRVQLWRVEADAWHLSRAYNIAASLASGEVLLKLDCDYLLRHTFFKQNELQPGAFIHGNKISDELNGFLMVAAEDFWRVRGYNEEIVTYGYDDDDIKNRLIAAGVKLAALPVGAVTHMPHSDELRVAHQPGTDPEQSAIKNKVLAAQSNWGRDGKPTTATCDNGQPLHALRRQI